MRHLLISKTGNKYIITVVDTFSRFALTKATRAVTTLDCQDFVKEIAARFGVPDIIITDQGPQFTSEEWKKAMNKLRIKQTTVLPACIQKREREL